MRGAGYGRGLMTAALVVAMAVPAAAQPRRKHKVGDVQGLERVTTIAPRDGFVDDPIVFGGAASRLLYINSDAAARCELQVLDAAQGFAQLEAIDLSKVTLSPIDARFVFGGDGFFVVYKVGVDEDSPKAAVLLDAHGKVKRKFGPATDVRLNDYEGEPAVSTYDVVQKRTKKGEVVVTHTIEARALATGKRVGKKVKLRADDTGRIARLDFRVQYWRDGYLTAVGIKGGSWDRKQDQRSPDVAAWYDVPRRTFSKRAPITDVTAHAKATRVRVEHSNESSFLRVTHDLTGLRWTRGSDDLAVTIAEPLHHYDPKSLRYQAGDDGGMYFSLTIDPVNADAVARKKADPKWLDLYRVEPGKTAARRVGRLLVGKRGVRWIAAEGYWAVLHKHVGFSRGGTRLDIYKVK